VAHVREESAYGPEEKTEEDSFLFIVDLVVEMAFSKLLEIGAIESNQPDYYYEKEQTASRLVSLVEKLEYQQKFIIKSYYFQQIPFKEIDW
jgi:DNA-directed RNA polymerase specialized sigma subunit